MRALRVQRQGPVATFPLQPETVSTPEPRAGEILIRVTACAICRTDLHIVEGDLPLARCPITPGHQIVGRVEATGGGTVRVRPGERVGAAWLRSTCGVCEWCRTGRENLCERAEFTGYHADGGFAEYVVIPEAFTYEMPSALDDVEAAPLLCAGIIGYRALRLADVPAGGRLGIYGFGSSAHITLQLARTRGLEVYVCTRDRARRDLALTLGAAWAGNVADRMPLPTHGTIVFAPAGELLPLALGNLAAGGTLALAGIYMTAVPRLAYADLYRERVIRTVTANTRADGREFLAEAERIPIRPAVTTFAFDDANVALVQLAHGGISGSGVLVVDTRGV